MQALQGAGQIIAEIRETHLWWRELHNTETFDSEITAYFIYELLCIAMVWTAHMKTGYPLKLYSVLQNEITHLTQINGCF